MSTPGPGHLTTARILAIDTASEQAGLALFDGQVASELSWPAGRTQTTSVLAEIHHLLSLNRIEPDQLTGIAVTTGPGTFNGLRVGLSVAKGLVLGLGLPIVGVETLAAAALPFAGLGRTVVPLVPAGRGRIVWSVYRSVDGDWREVSPARNSTVGELMQGIDSPEPVLITGELSADQVSEIEADGHFLVAPAALRTRRPAAVATIGWRRFQTGDHDVPATLEPRYAGRDRS